MHFRIIIPKCILFPSFCGASNGQGGGIPSSYLALAQHRCEWHTWCTHIFFLLYYLLSTSTCDKEGCVACLFSDFNKTWGMFPPHPQYRQTEWGEGLPSS